MEGWVRRGVSDNGDRQPHQELILIQAPPWMHPEDMILSVSSQTTEATYGVVPLVRGPGLSIHRAGETQRLPALEEEGVGRCRVW